MYQEIGSVESNFLALVLNMAEDLGLIKADVKLPDVSILKKEIDDITVLPSIYLKEESA